MLSVGDRYLNTAFAVTAFVWMLFNIILSIWFFVSSLNVLDESKRDRLLNKFFLSQIVDDYIQKAYILAWLRYPGANVGENYLGNIKILPYSISEKNEMLHVKSNVSKGDVVTDIYIRPFLFLLRRLEAVDGQDAEIIILPSFGVRSGELTLMSLKNIKPVSGLWRWLFIRCIVTGRPEKKRIWMILLLISLVRLTMHLMIKILASSEQELKD